MDEPDFTGNRLRGCRIAIWGLGLMGGSLALALRNHCASLIGIDSDPDTLILASERGIVDRLFSVESLRAQKGAPLKEVDIILLAVPVRGILGLIADLAELPIDGAMVMDIGSTKAEITAAMDRLPDRFEAVGGHPMCGKEKSSLLYADASIFNGATFALVAGVRTTPNARALAEALVQIIGACPLWLAADEHDRWVAATSHTPFMLASALAQATTPDVLPMVGPGFRSTVRLAGSSPQMMVDILATNRENVLAALRAVQTELEQMDKMLQAEDYQSLAGRLAQGVAQYNRLTGGHTCE